MKLESKPAAIALAPLVKLSTRRTTIPALNCLCLEAKDGLLTATGTDIDTWLEVSVPCDGDLPALLVNAKRFADCLNGAENVELSPTKADRLAVKGGGWRMELGTLDAKQFPARPDVSGKPIGVNLGDLASGIEGVAWATTEDDSTITNDRVFTMTVLVDASPTSLRCMAINEGGKMVVVHKRATIAEERRFHVPGAGAEHLVDVLRREGSELLVSDKRIVARCPASLVSLAVLEAKWPNVQRVLDMPRAAVGKVDRTALYTAARRCASIFPQKFARTLCTVREGKLSMEAESGLDSATDSVAIEGEAKGEFAIDACLLANALKHFADGAIALAIGESGIVLEQGDSSCVIARLVGKAT